jgi:hypothetical protein
MNVTQANATKSNGIGEFAATRSPIVAPMKVLIQTNGIKDRRSDGQTPIAALANTGRGSDMNTSEARQKVFRAFINFSFGGHRNGVEEQPGDYERIC